MSAREELEAELREIVGKGLRQDAFYPVVAPKTPEQTAQVVKAARDHRYNVLVLGNESSKPPQLSTLRENILVILNVWLTGIEKVSPFSVRVLGGTPVSSVVRGGSEPPRKTIGGLICGMAGSDHDASLRALWSRVRSIDVILSTGEIQKFAGPGTVSVEDPAGANLFLGSRGRLGVIAAVEMATPIPVAVLDGNDRANGRTPEAGEPLLSPKDIQTLLDPNGLFQW
ncbi:MAG TPA: FAD-binding protein [bacterium]|jgi:FAD/FMN-containing dehydrogenase